MMKKYILNYKNATYDDKNQQWNIPHKEAISGIHDIYEEDGVMYQDCPFCGQQNRYDEWTCNRCGAQ